MGVATVGGRWRVRPPRARRPSPQALDPPPYPSPSQHRLGVLSSVFGDCDPMPSGNLLASYWNSNYTNATGDGPYGQAVAGLIEVRRAAAVASSRVSRVPRGTILEASVSLRGPRRNNNVPRRTNERAIS